MEKTWETNKVNRYLRKQRLIEKQPPVEKHVERRYAGFWMRLWSFLFDLLLVSAINGLFVGTWLPAVQADESQMEYILTLFLLPTVLYGTLFFLYFAIMTKCLGQTLGKMIFGLEVVSATGKPLTWTQVFFREGVGRLLHQAPLPLNFNQLLYIVVACTPKKQGVHDLIAETYVIHRDDERN